MPVSLTCPGCAVRLKAPDGSAGHTLRCPRCQGSVVVPAPTGSPADLAVERSVTGDDANPFDDAGPTSEKGDVTRRAGRRATAKKAKPGYNPFDEAADEPPQTEGEPRKRRYRKDADFNPFGEGPDTEVPDPAGEGFEFGLEAPPPAATGEFDFGPLDPRGEDPDDPRRRRR